MHKKFKSVNPYTEQIYENAPPTKGSRKSSFVTKNGKEKRKGNKKRKLKKTITTVENIIPYAHEQQEHNKRKQ